MAHSHCTESLRSDFIHITGHQFDCGVLKGFAAVVVHGDPADEVHKVAFFGRNEIVTRAPVQPFGDIADFGVELSEHIQFCIDAMKPLAEQLGLQKGAGEG